MKKNLALILLGIIFVVSSQMIYAEEDNRLLVAVVDFKNQTDNPENDTQAKALTGTFINELQSTKKFRIIERERLENLLQEIKLNMTGLVDPEKAKQIGKQLGIDAFIFGNLSAVKYSKSKQTILIMYTSSQKVEVSLDARIVKVETGEIINTASVTSPYSERKWVAFWFAKLGKSSDKDTAIRSSIESACKKLAINLAKTK